MRNELKDRLKQAGLVDPISWHDASESDLKKIVSVESFDSKVFYRKMRQNNTWARLITTHITLEKISLEFLKQEMPNHNIIKLPRLSLKQKIDLLFALGNIDKRIYDQISYLNSTRNNAAHDYEFSLPTNFQRRLQSLFPKNFWEELGKPALVHYMLVVIVTIIESRRQELEYRWLRKEGAMANIKRVLNKFTEEEDSLEMVRSSITQLPKN